MIQHNGLNLRYNQVIGMEHDETLSGDGSNQSPLGVMWSSLPNDVVKSADIADMATTGDIDSLVTSIAETYQTTAGMTAYQSAGNYYSASNPSGFITGVPVGTMNESSFGYDASDNITGYNGSAFKAGDEFPQSATEAIETVTANSASWNTVSDKLDASAVNSALRPLYGLIISGIDNIPISAKVSDSANYAKFDENGIYLTSYLTAVPTGTMNEADLRFDSNNLIESYNGSAFAAALPASAEAILVTVDRYAADWNGTTETVSSNSGAWGGSALPISAGPGIKFEMVNGTLVASNDETVLWESDTPSGKIITAGIDLSETMNNFKEVKFVYRNGINYAPVDYISPHSALVNFNFVHAGGGTNSWMQWSQFSAINNGTKIYMTKCKALNYGNATSTGNVVITATTANDLFYLYQVVGINRIAGV